MEDFPRPIVAVHQPNYAPWIGYFVKAAAADAFVLLDDVQFSKGSWTNRARIAGPKGPGYLTVPVRHGGFAEIRETRIADRDWPRRHLARVRASYRGAPGLPAAEDALREDGLSGREMLADANEVMLGRLRGALGLRGDWPRSSTLGVEAEDPTDRLVGICRALGGRTYLSGAGGASYHDEGKFRAAGIAVAYHRFVHPIHPQPGPGFLPGLSALDLLCMTGERAAGLFAEAVASVVLAGRPTAPPSG